MRVSLRITVVMVAILLVAVLTPALAETRTRTDPRGDHWGSERFDIRKLIVSHSDRRVTFRVRMWNSPQHRHVAFRAYVYVRESFRDVTMILHTDGKTDGRVWRDGPDPGPYDHVPVRGCPVRTEWRPGERMAVFSITRSCLPRGPRIQVGVVAASIAFSQDPQDYVPAISVQRG